MYYLSLPYFNLRTIKSSVSVMLCLFLFACSTTESINNSSFVDKRYDNSRMNKHFSHTQFTPNNKSTIKKAMSSDHELMMSVLNRPITADQAMILALKQERANYGPYFSNYTVRIRGDRNSDTTNVRTENIYTQLISQDINAIDISAPN